jgi:hypothetical protein
MSNLCIFPTDGVHRFRMSFRTVIISLHSINKLILVMEVRCVFFDVGTQLVNIKCVRYVLQRVNVC